MPLSMYMIHLLPNAVLQTALRETCSTHRDTAFAFTGAKPSELSPDADVLDSSCCRASALASGRALPAAASPLCTA